MRKQAAEHKSQRFFIRDGQVESVERVLGRVRVMREVTVSRERPVVRIMIFKETKYTAFSSILS